jgi:hypothetical protein
MAEAFFLVNEKTGREFRIVSVSEDQTQVTLVGEFGVPFTEKFDKEAFKASGYKPVKKQVETTYA